MTIHCLPSGKVARPSNERVNRVSIRIRRFHQNQWIPLTRRFESPGAPEDFADLGKILAIIPTYNESGNIERITARVRAAVPSAHILVADDNSPDGTGKIADSLADEDDHSSCIDSAGRPRRGLSCWIHLGH